MSTKTSIKRIALVAVSALGFGLISTIPASAAEVALTDITSFSTWTATHASNRTGVVAEFDSQLNNTFDGDAADGETASIKTALLTKPAGSLAATTVACEDDNGDADSDNTNYSSANCTYTVTETDDADPTLDVDLRVTPDVVGTYEYIIWHDRDGQGDIDTGEKYKTGKFTAVAGADAVGATLAAVNATSSAGEADGSLLKVTITTSAATPASLSGLESFTLAASGGTLTEIGGGNADTGASITLSRNDFNGKGIAFVRLTSAVATRVVTLSANLGASLAGINKTTSVTFKTVTAETVNEADGAVTFSNTTGVEEETAFQDDADARWEIKDDVSTTIAFKATMDGVVADNGGTYLNVKVSDTTGKITGLVGAEYDIAALVASTGTYANKAEWSVTVALDNDATTAETFAVSFDDEDQAAGNDYGAGDAAVVVGSEDSAQTLVTAGPATTLRSVSGSTITLTGTVTDQFGLPMANSAVTVSHGSRNAHIANSSLSTNADGVVSYTFKDAPLATDLNTSGTVTFTATDTDVVTITYAATLGVSTVVLTGGNTTAGVTSATVTNKDIDAGIDGPSATTHAVTATVKDANGSVLVGAPVTWTISGTGAAITSTTATSYTSSTGVATAQVYGWIAGTYTVTATAGGVAGTATITFAQTASGEERTLSASVSGAIVSAKLVDRFGNPVPSATVYATKTGVGYFGNGVTKTSGTTDANGVVEFAVAGGDAQVTVSTIDYAAAAGTYGSGQTSAPKGYVANASTAAALALNAFTAYTAGTTLVDEEGVGASFDAAGVATVSVSVTGVNVAATAAEAATDAALEAIDAANAATDAANLAAEAADAATVAAEEARDAADAATAAVEALATEVASLINGLKAQITTLANTVAKIAKKVKA